MLDHLGHSIGAEHLLAVILSHNIQLVQLVQKETIDKVLSTFARDCKHDQTVLEFLTSLCSCNGSQVRNNQAYIGSSLQLPQVKSLLITTAVEDSQLVLKWQLAEGVLQTVLLEDVLDETDQAYESVFEFYLAQIMLFSEMCYGTDVREASKCVSAFFTWKNLQDILLAIIGYNTETFRTANAGEHAKGFKISGGQVCLSPSVHRPFCLIPRFCCPFRIRCPAVAGPD